MSFHKKNNLQVFYALSIAWQLGFLIVVPIVGFVLLGLWGDKVLHTQPFLLLAGFGISLIVTIYETYHLLLPLITNEDASH